MLISEAYAQSTPAGPGGMDLMGLLPLVLMFVLLYFLMIRPQAKKAKEHKNLIASLQKGDEVVTGGGVLGKVSKVGDQYLSIEVAPNMEIQVQRFSIQLVLPKGTIK